MRDVLFVAAGGMIGCVARFLAVSLVVRLLPSAFPFGTFTVNIAESFIMGAAVGLADRYVWMHQGWRVFLTAGFCGGFTTFSAFAFENVELLLDRNYGTFAAYCVASFAMCISFALAGSYLRDRSTKKLHQPCFARAEKSRHIRNMPATPNYPIRRRERPSGAGRRSY